MRTFIQQKCHFVFGFYEQEPRNGDKLNMVGSEWQLELLYLVGSSPKLPLIGEGERAKPGPAIMLRMDELGKLDG